MNGVGRKSLLAGCLVACAAVTGCSHNKSYSDLVDPCWPQRYNCMARDEVNSPFGVQISNGLALDQTVWNYHFAEGKSDLNLMGQEHLARLARRRPGPAPELYVQVSNDVHFDQAKPVDQFIAARDKLNTDRMKAVTDYMAAIRPDVPFKVAVHDPSPVGMAGIEADLATQSHLRAVQGSINGGVSAQNEASRAGSQPDINVNQTNSRPQ